MQQKTMNVLSEEEVRRLFIDDSQWERTSHSWKSLKPYKNFDHIDENDEGVDLYSERINKIYKIPKEILEQWLYVHYYNGNTVDNYGWIDFNKTKFELVELPYSILKDLKVIKAFRKYVNEGSNYKAYDQFNCITKDKEFWVANNTWRVPPVVIDVESFRVCPIPEYADLTDKYQLVEGHTRFGYFNSAEKCGKPINRNHKVYLMRYIG